MAYNKETGMWEGYIYKITNIKNEKIYIGQTIRTVHDRWMQHKQVARSDNPKQPISQAIKKYGACNFAIEEIGIVCNKDKETMREKLDKLEQESIQKYNSLAGNGKGYNLQKGGHMNNTKYCPVVVYTIDGSILNKFDSYMDAGNYYNIHTHAIRKICRGEQYNYLGQLVFRDKNDSFDKYPTRDSFHNFSEYFPDYTHELIDGYYDPIYVPTCKIDVYDKQSFAYITTYDSCSECALELGIPIEHIPSVCRGKRGYIDNYIFRYHGEPLDKYDYNKFITRNKKAVNQYTLDGIFITQHNSLADAAKYLNQKYSINISKCCNKQRNKAYGFSWYFSDDPDQPDKSKIIA